MSLEPQDDNRDGVAIRIASEDYYNVVINNVFNCIFGWRTICI